MFASTSAPSTLTQQTADSIDRSARHIAEVALTASGGRNTFDWEGPDFRMTYAGDTPDGFGQTRRSYRLPNGDWSNVATERSGAGTGMVNLAIEHFAGCEDPVFLAKRDIIWELLAVSEQLFALVVAEYRGPYSGLTTESGVLLDELRVRLTEVLEQKVLENPGTGLNLSDIAGGTSLVGWAKAMLSGSVYYTMLRLRQNLATQRAFSEAVDEDEYSDFSDIADSEFTESAESQYLEQRDRASLEHSVATHIQLIAKARGHEQTVLRAWAVLSHLGLPAPKRPTPELRRQMLAELDETPELAWDSLEAYSRLNDPVPRHLQVPDHWVELWRTLPTDAHGYSPGAEELLATAARNRTVVETIVLAVIGFHSPLTTAARRRAAAVLSGDIRDVTLRKLVTEVINGFDLMRTTGATADFAQAANEFIAHPLSPMKSIGVLGDALDDAVRVQPPSKKDDDAKAPVIRRQSVQPIRA